MDQQIQQNTTQPPSPTRPHTIAKYELLTPTIIELVIENGLNKSQIAKKLGIHRDTVTNIMRSIQFQDYAGTLLNQQLRTINTMMETGKSYEMVQAMNERGRILRALIPSKVQIDKTINIQGQITIKDETDKRRNLIRELTTDEYTVISTIATQLNNPTTQDTDPPPPHQDPEPE